MKHNMLLDVADAHCCHLNVACRSAVASPELGPRHESSPEEVCVKPPGGGGGADPAALDSDINDAYIGTCCTQTNVKIIN